MDKKGAIPIPYIIALLLGIAVVAILGYWFFVLGGRWGGEVSLQNCRNKAITYCTTWQTSGYAEDDDGDPSPLGWFGRVADAPTDTYATECSRFRSDLGFSELFDIDDDMDNCKNTILAAD